MGYYEIKVENHLDPRRLRDFEGFDVQFLPEGNTLFSGTVKDQAELFSVLNRIRDRNLTLISVVRSPKVSGLHEVKSNESMI